MNKRRYKILLTLIVTLFIAILLMTYSHCGSSLLVNLLNRNIDNLSLTLAPSSNLLSPNLAHISYADKNSNLQASDVSIDWGWRCFWRSAICLDDLSVASLSITLNQVNDTPSPQKTAAILPFSIELSQSEITRLDINAPQFSLHAKQLASSFTLNDRTFGDVTINAKYIETNLPADKTTNSSRTFEEQIHQWATYYQNNDIKLPMSLDVTDVAIKQFVIKSNDKQYSINTIDASFQLVPEKLDITNASADFKNTHLSMSGHLMTTKGLIHRLALSADSLSLPYVGDNRVSLISNGRLSDLTLELNTQGTLPASAIIQGDLTQQHLPLALAVKWQDWQTNINGQDVKVVAGTFDAEYEHEQWPYTLTGGLFSEDAVPATFRLSGHGNAKGLTITDGNIHTLNGTISPRGSIEWLDTIKGKLDMTIDSLSSPPQLSTQVTEIAGKINSTFELTNEHWLFEMNHANLTALWQQRHLSLNAIAQGQSQPSSPWGAWQFEQIRIGEKENYVTARGKLAQELAAEISVNMPNINQIAADYHGSVSGKLRLSGQLEQPELIGSFNIEQLRNANDSIKLERGDVYIDANLTQVLNGKLVATADNIKFEQYAINDAKIKLWGDLNKHQLSVTSHGQPFALNLSASGSKQHNRWQGVIDNATIITPLDNWVIKQPLTITANQTTKTITIDNHCWQQSRSEASVCLTQPWQLNGKDSSSNQSNVTLSNFDIKQLNQFIDYPIKIEGILSNSINFSFSPGHQLNVVSDSEIANATTYVHFQEREIAHQFSLLTSKIIIGPKLSSVTVAAQSSDLGDASMTVLTDIFAAQPQLTGHIEVSGLHLTPYQMLIPTMARIDGEINASAGFTGTLQRPLFFGHVDINDATLASTAVPTILQKLNSKLTFDGQRAYLKNSFTLGDGQGTLNGMINWQGLPKASLLLQGEQLSVAQNKDRKVTFSPDIAIDMSQEYMKVRGDVIIDDGLVKLRELPTSAVSLSDDVKIKSARKVKNTLFDMDISLLVEDSFEVQAFGLRSNIQGKLTLSQQPNKPLNTFGDMALVDATYKAMGQNLEITKGQLIFTGVLQNPLLNIEAIRSPKATQDGVIAGLYVSGNVKKPDLAIFSQPAMDQQDALSYLLRGRGLKSQNNDSTNDMAVAMLLNSGIGQSSRFVGDIGDKFGIEQLSLNTTGSGKNTKLEVSGYIAPKLELRYGIGITDGSPEVGLRYQLSTQFFVEFVSNTAQALDLLYKFSFD